VRARLLAAVAAGAVALAPAALAKTSHAHVWQNHSATVFCGYRNQGAKPATQLICSAKGIPRPTGQKSCDSGFVVMGASGKPKPIVTCQSEFPAGIPATLKNGTSWTGLGISCTAGKTVTCTNGSGHGFTIGDGKYKHF
jgi:hypothetical protein